VFEKQSKGEITTASEEQIRELSKSCSHGGRSHGGGESMWDIKPSSLTSKKPLHSNNHGRSYEISRDDCPQLRALDIEVGLTNISSVSKSFIGIYNFLFSRISSNSKSCFLTSTTCLHARVQGSMIAPGYSTHADKLLVVLDGSGYFEMACPHLSSSGRSPSPRRERGHGGREWGREEEEEEEEAEQEGGQQKSRGYKQVKSRIREGSVVVIPAGHPTTLVAGEDKNLAVLYFSVNARHDEKVFLAGSNSLLRQMDEAAKALAFGAEKEKVDRVIGAQSDAVFLRGPSSRRVESA
jgi:hypothetical protein